MLLIAVLLLLASFCAMPEMLLKEYDVAEEQKEEIGTFLAEILQVKVPTIVKSAKLKDKRVYVTCEGVEVLALVILGIEDNIVYGCSVLQDDCETLLDTELTDEEAWRTCLPALDYYHVAPERKEFIMSHRKRGAEALIAFTKRYEYKDLACRQAFLNVAVSARKGKVREVEYQPPRIPTEKPVENIPKEEAVRHATDFLRNNWYLGGLSPKVTQEDRRLVQKVIAPPNKLFVLPPKEFVRQGVNWSESRYSWEVPFEYQEGARTFQSVLWVDIETGEVIGGSGKVEGE